MKKINIILSQPRGFCAGVERAIEIVEKSIEKYGTPVYVRHEIVHNKYVVDDLKKKGAIFINELDEVPDNAITIFSAHGVSEKIEQEAKDRNLPVIDATCPLVTKVHKEAQMHENQGREIILIGHLGHPEVEGTSGRVKNKAIIVSSVEEVDLITVKDPAKLSYVTQTTLSIDDTAEIIAKLKERFPQITGPELRDICYATQNRQNAVRQMSKLVDCILVIGASNSSNSNRLRDLGESCGVDSYLITGASDINLAWLNEVSTIGITAGASAPECLVKEVVDYLSNIFLIEINTMDGIIEKTKFKLPKEISKIDGL